LEAIATLAAEQREVQRALPSRHEVADTMQSLVALFRRLVNELEAVDHRWGGLAYLGSAFVRNVLGGSDRPLLDALRNGLAGAENWRAVVSGPGQHDVLGELGQPDHELTCAAAVVELYARFRGRKPDPRNRKAHVACEALWWMAQNGEAGTASGVLWKGPLSAACSERGFFARQWIGLVLERAGAPIKNVPE
jgi:hypothetical protein